jgi:hypothetical protein
MPASHQTLDDFPDVPSPSRWQNFKRSFVSHTAVFVFASTITAGLCLEDKSAALAETTATLQQLAVYGRCAARDQLNNFYWHPFDVAEPETEAPKKPARPKSRIPAAMFKQ